MSQQQTLIKTVLGTSNFGYHPMATLQGNPQDYLDTFKRYGFKDLDTARIYGTSEDVLGQLKVTEQGFVIDTKFNSFTKPGLHNPESLKESIKTSLSALGVNKVHILYLHAPDRETPFEDTLRGVNEIYKQGAFEKVKYQFLKFLLTHVCLVWTIQLYC